MSVWVLGSVQGNKVVRTGICFEVVVIAADEGAVVDSISAVG